MEQVAAGGEMGAARKRVEGKYKNKKQIRMGAVKSDVGGRNGK
jgi:hypothetical protein